MKQELKILLFESNRLSTKVKRWTEDKTADLKVFNKKQQKWRK